MASNARSEQRDISLEGRQKHLLIVEDSRLVGKILKHLASSMLPDYTVHYATTYKEGCELFEQHQHNIFAAIIDLNLPDAPNGEMAGYLLSNELPIIVLTGNYSDESRERLLLLGVVDYVTKESQYSYEHAIGLVRRLEKNQSIKIVVAEDSQAQQMFITSLLEQHLYQVITANNGAEALAIIEQDPSINLLITDYNMPQMDGFELTKALRRKFNKSELIIIGLSGVEQKTLSARFIKNGANDFLCKPFIQEEFHCRVTHNIEAQEQLNRIREWAYHDALTNLYNRRYLFDKGLELHKNARKNGEALSIAVIDIDHFKQINDTYGHDVGDKVLIAISSLLTSSLGDYPIIRMGGEEFCIVMPNKCNQDAYDIIDQFRDNLAGKTIVADPRITITISAGVASALQQSLDDQINAADKLLYQAKEDGRNRTVKET
ncbi:diguanylate cyclase [Oceanicoccus sagamiensis]|uniref:diguanylate cyclase n=1 Tax=Oceanicoccus sagamiensis TaxID=716816 RepID=A0A1X9NL64_9GAMM|nr:diguanylate cyclase [Oceanicoccus sagamiensis]ARN76159.1 hypothetical protein BST96_19880 [Oceanicoccus sagamiensis]